MHSLSQLKIAVPETRQLDVLANLLLKRGADVLRCPLVSILDTPDQAAVIQWLREFCRSTPDYFVIITGEGLRRLLDCAKRNDLYDDFVVGLQNTQLIVRGPKPQRVLRELSIKAQHVGEAPTSVGVQQTLTQLPLAQSRVALQLYGDDPNRLLCDYITGTGAQLSTVAPYIYASKLALEQVETLVLGLCQGEFDAMVFTSQPQFKRLQQVAKGLDKSEQLIAGMQSIAIAAVGPVVRDQLQKAGLEVKIMPKQNFHMKPLVKEMERVLGGV